MVMTVLAVVVLYHTDKSYWWPGVTLGAQDRFSIVIALRSPLVMAVTATFIAFAPVRPGWTTVKAYVLSPQPAVFQQTGKLLASSASRPALVRRLALATAAPSGTRDASSASTTAPARRARRLT